MKKIFTITVLLVITGMLLSACGSSTAPTEKPVAPDLLETITTRGTLVISTDPAYPPQSALKAEPKRSEGTKCTTDQKTVGELEGFDIDTAVAIASAMGVEPCFVTPDWGLIVSGNWSGRWDISVGSVTVTPERLKVLYFAQPYYSVPASMFVHKDNTSFTTPADLSGKKIGVCSGCTYDNYLGKTLEIPGSTIDFIINDAEIKGYDTDSTALEDLSLGDGLRLDGVLTAQPTGLDAINNGRPLKQLGDPVYFEFNAPAIDRSSSLDTQTFLAKVSEIVKSLQADGTMLELSMKWYNLDYATPAFSIDISEFNK